jgi:hypothetical protein
MTVFYTQQLRKSSEIVAFGEIFQKNIPRRTRAEIFTGMTSALFRNGDKGQTH